MLPSAFTNLFDECEGISSPKKEGASLRNEAQDISFLLTKNPFFVIFVPASGQVFSFIEKHSAVKKTLKLHCCFREAKTAHPCKGLTVHIVP